MRRSFIHRNSYLAVLGAVAITGLLASGAQAAADFATIVPGSLTQGTVTASLTGGAYATETNNLGDWPLNTGNFAGSTFAISFENTNFNATAFGGTANTMVAFGNGGGVTLKLNTPITPSAGRKDLGLFTAQGLGFGVGSFANGNMEAAILVSANGTNWFTLTGAAVATPTTYTATSVKLNAPTMAYNYGTSAIAATDGGGASDASLAALTIANFTTPMPNDNLFNGTGTDAQRLALVTDNSAANYTSIFGTSGGGNWFDVSGSGLSQINYIRLNGVNVPSTGGIRLDAVFANAAAVPEPASLALLALGAMALCNRRRAK